MSHSQNKDDGLLAALYAADKRAIFFRFGEWLRGRASMRTQTVRNFALASAISCIAIFARPGFALEPLQGPQTKPGSAIGASAGALPPGIYMVNYLFYYGFQLTGPGVLPGPQITPRGYAIEDEQAFLFVPGWSFLGGTYTAYLAFPFVAESAESALEAGVPGHPPVPFPGVSRSGVHNTFIAPIRLHWNLGNGFFVQAGAGVHVPDGTIRGPLGDSNVGADYFTFQPNFVLSYFKEGWNLTAYAYYEINTKNQRSGYRTGDIFHVDLTATKKFGKWTIGPVGYYVAQTTSDSPGANFDAALTTAFSSAFMCGPGCVPFHGFNAGKFEAFAVGGLVGYDFGPATLTVWATDEVFARTHGGFSGAPSFVAAVLGTSEIPFVTDTTTKGWSVFARLTYQLWGPESPPPQKPIVPK